MRLFNTVLASFTLFGLLLSAAPAFSSAGDKISEEEKKQPIEIQSDKLRSENEGKKIIFSGNVVSTWGDLEIKSDILEVYANPKAKDKKQKPSSQDQPQQDLEKVIAIGNVQVKKGDRTAKGDRAIYDNKEQSIVITGDPHATAWEGKNLIKGQHMVFFLEKNSFEVTGDRTILILFPNNPNPEEEKKKPIEIQANHLHSENEGKKIIFSGNVVSTWEDLEIISDILEVYANPKAKDKKRKPTSQDQPQQNLEKVIAIGNVKVKKGDRRAKGDQANYDNQAQSIVITGDPNATAWEGEKLITGKQMIFFLEENRFEVKGGRPTVHLPF